MSIQSDTVATATVLAVHRSGPVQHVRVQGQRLGERLAGVDLPARQGLADRRNDAW
jgi:hypothetical protein